MVHRASLQRNMTTGTDRLGQPAAPSWSTVEELACRAWNRRREAVRDGEKVVTVQSLRAAFPKDADIREGDRLASITNRRGTVLYAGPLQVEEIVWQPTHLECHLERP